MTSAGDGSQYYGMRGLKRPVLSIRDTQGNLVYDRDTGIKTFSGTYKVLGVTLVHPAVIRSFHEAGREEEADELVDQAAAMFASNVTRHLKGVSTLGPKPGEPYAGKKPKNYVVLNFAAGSEMDQKQEVHEASALFGTTGDESPAKIGITRPNSFNVAERRSQEVAAQINFPAAVILGAAEPYIFAKRDA